MKVIQLMLQVQIREGIVEGIADVCVPQLMEERSEDQKSNPQMQVEIAPRCKPWTRQSSRFWVNLL